MNYRPIITLNRQVEQSVLTLIDESRHGLIDDVDLINDLFSMIKYSVLLDDLEDTSAKIW